VIIPHENEKDLVEIPVEITGKLDIRPVKWIDEVLDLALAEPMRPATPVAAATATEGKAAPESEGDSETNVIRPH
jgi:ATP-dependent Lon protease